MIGGYCGPVARVIRAMMEEQMDVLILVSSTMRSASAVCFDGVEVVFGRLILRTLGPAGGGMWMLMRGSSASQEDMRGGCRGEEIGRVAMQMR